MQNLLQGVIDLRAPTQRLSERGCANRHDHELLEIHVVVCVLAAVQDVHHRRGQHVSVCAANILVKRKLCGLCSSLGNSQRSTKNGVCAEIALVFGAVKLKHDCIDTALIVGFHTDKSIGNFFVDVSNSLQRALAQVTLGIAIAKLHCFKSTGGCTGRNSGTTCCIIVENNLYLYRGVATGVKDLTTEHIDDGTHVISSLETFCSNTRMIPCVPHSTRPAQASAAFTVKECTLPPPTKPNMPKKQPLAAGIRGVPQGWFAGCSRSNAPPWKRLKCRHGETSALSRG